MTALVVEHVDPATLQADPDNAMTHPELNRAAVMASLVQFGFVEPLVVWHGRVLGGNCRLDVALELQHPTVPIVRVDHLDATGARALAIALNQSGRSAEWNSDVLAQQLRQLNEAAADMLPTLGFDTLELDHLLAAGLSAGSTAERVSPDDAPEAPADPITQPGDLWMLGDHRLLCGDCTKASDVGRLLGGVVPVLMATDPPYGVEYDPEWRHRMGLNKSQRTGKVTNDDVADWTPAWRLFPGNVAHVWHGGLHSATVQQSLRVAGLFTRSQIIWVKPRMVLSRGHYHWKHEPAWYAVRKGASAGWRGGRKQTTVWEIGFSGEVVTTHGTQKPVECMARPIRNNSRPGDAVYDPFLGSGTTLVAAEMLGRRCFGMEISPAYCDVIVERWRKLTGKTPQRVPAGESAAA